MKIGYKGTNSDMKCRNVQYELGKTYFIDSDNQVRELPNGCSFTKTKVVICSNEAIHYCDNLLDVFQYYKKDSSRFFKVEIIGEFEDGDEGKSGARCIRFIEEVSEKEMENFMKEQEEVKLDEKMLLPQVKKLQELNPYLIVGGSISLYLQGVRLKRFHDGGIDYDFTTPFYQPMELPEDVEMEDGEDERSGSDYEENFFLDGIKADMRIDPKQKYELVDYKGFKYKVIPLITVIKAKAEYALTKWGEKHREDIKEMILK